MLTFVEMFGFVLCLTVFAIAAGIGLRG